jgi:DNA-binding MarR family transcriptional regulator/GNAT superfamily N-acetyltransferase
MKIDAVSGQDRIVREIRAFNRDYTRLIGALDYEHRLGTPYSLPEARVLYELSRRELTAVTELRQDLDMDPGQLSRLLARLEERHLVTRERDAHDTRRQVVRLTGAGREAAALLDARSREAVGALVARLPPREVERLTAALRTVGRLLDGGASGGQCVLRAPGPGDLGWVIERHGAVYAGQFGWDGRFEALVAGVVADYARTRDPAREAAWIAEVDGERVGSIFCVDDGASGDGTPTARLRLLLVEPHARGLGVGGRLVGECLRFARGAGYGRMVLWTNDVLTSARRIYEGAGFRLVREEPHAMFGPPMVGQDWALEW